MLRHDFEELIPVQVAKDVAVADGICAGRYLKLLVLHAVVTFLTCPAALIEYGELFEIPGDDFPRLATLVGIVVIFR